MACGFTALSTLGMGYIVWKKSKPQEKTVVNYKKCAYVCTAEKAGNRKNNKKGLFKCEKY